jgi:hypothetical protein
MKARLLAAVVTLAATLAVGVTGRPAEVQAAPGCADVLFIGVHGVGEDPISGEPPTKANGNNNMGPTIYRMFTDFRNKIRAQSSSTNVGGFGVNYPKIDIG